jgi:microcystin-dependent protein
MPATYQTLVTNYGQAALASAISGGTTVQLSTLVVGDGNGSATTPSALQTALVNQVHSVSLNSVSVDPLNPNYIIAEAVIPSSVGGWTIREAGLKDLTGNLFAVANYADTFKPVVASGTAADLVIRFIFQVSNTAAVTLLIDPSVVMASQSWVLGQNFIKRDGSVAMTGPLTLSGDPTLSLHAASKQYVDSRSGVDSVPIGTVHFFAANTAPAGYLECDGSAVSRTTYSALFTRIGTTYGTGDGSTTFNLPDLRGRFLRGWDHGAGRDISVFTGNQTNLSATISGLSSTATMYVGQPVSGTNIPNGTTIASITNSTTIVLSAAATATITGNSLTFTGRAFATAQADDFKSHAHRFATFANIVNGASPTTATLADWEAGGATQGPGNVEPLGGAETRPINVSLLPCIKAYLLSNVDIALINGAINLYVAKAGDTMTGPLVLSGAPTLNLHATTKAYVDGLISTCQAALGYTPLNKAGDTMTGFLLLSGAPTSTLHAATKQYVDTADALKVALTDFTGNQLLAASGYQKIPGGLIFQWGTSFPAANSTLTVSLPVTFPSAVIGVMATYKNSSYTIVDSLAANVVSTSQILLANGNDSSGPIFWVALGY